MADRLRLTLVKSPISHTARTRGTVRALGLRRIGQTVEVADTRELRGMVRAVAFLLQTEELDGRAVEPASTRVAAEPAADATEAATPAPRSRKKKEESEA